MDWKKYEKEIFRYFSETFPDTTVRYDQKITGKFSKILRQIDILIEGSIVGYTIKIIVDCKYFSKKVDIKDVESFSMMVEDVEANQGIIITNKGFTKGAIQKAYYGFPKIELDIISFDSIQYYQGSEAMPYRGENGVLLSAPFGWIVDIKNKINGIASLYQRGIDFSQALENREWMYIDFSTIRENEIDPIDNLMKTQNERVLQLYPDTDFEFRPLIRTKRNNEIKIRIAYIKTYPAVEVTGFIRFEEFIFFAVLFTPKEFLERNIRKIYLLLSSCIPMKVQFENENAIQSITAEIESTKSNEERSHKYNKIGKLYVEMSDYKNALLNFKKSVEYFPTHFGYLNDIIDFSLRHNENEEAIEYSSVLFSLEPKNPTAPSCIIDLFIKNEKSDLIIPFFNEQKAKYEDPEVKGNIHFHLGHFFLFLNQNKKASKNFLIAKDYFKESLPSNHYVFRTINKIIKHYGL